MPKKYAIYKCVLGYLKISYQENFITNIDLIEKTDQIGTPCALSDKVNLQIAEYLAGMRTKFAFNYKLEGTIFQKKVWQALLTIPLGETRTYKEIAIMIDNPRAARAVGNANNKNPLMIVVPCHRVIGANGSLVGYASGIAIKEQLLQIEQNNFKTNNKI